MPMAPPAASDTAMFDTQRTGRMGELVVELELLRRGWLVGNFNATTMNSAGYDLFATRGDRSVKIRVKASRPGVVNFRWSAKADGNVFLGNTGADDDFVIAVSFEADGTHAAYIVPTAIVEDTLHAEHQRWLSGEKSDGGARKDTPMRSVYMDDRDDGSPSRGFASRWASYKDAWDTL
jgi:hypothetical protein